MNPIARFLRRLSKLRFRWLNLATMKDIPTERLNEVLQLLEKDGWRRTGEYKGFDAWIDYGRVSLRRAGVRLKVEWDNWTEGSIEGPRATVEDLGRKLRLPVTYEWRWSEYDEAHR